MSLPSPLLTVDRVRAVLEAGGYRGTAVLLSGSHLLSPGCVVALQFGDQTAVGAGGTACLTIRCSLRVNGQDDRVTDMTYWQIRKSLCRPIASERLDVAIEADLLLGSDITLADVLTHGRDVYRHLRLLIADARDALHEQFVGGACPHQSAGPVLRIEAKFRGDLAVGRSGLVASGNLRPSGPQLRMTAAVCDWLRDRMLPDLARAVRSMILQASSSLPFQVQSDATAESHRWPDARPIRFANNSSIVPVQ